MKILFRSSSALPHFLRTSFHSSFSSSSPLLLSLKHVVAIAPRPAALTAPRIAVFSRSCVDTAANIAKRDSSDKLHHVYDEKSGLYRFGNSSSGGGKFPPQRQQRGRLLLFALGGLLLLWVLSSVEKVPVIGRLRLMLVPERWVERMAEAELGRIMSTSQVLPPNHKYSKIVKRVGERIARVTGDTQIYNWEFIVVDSPLVNAMCLPGGKVVFFRGLLEILEYEGEVAGVMAHEISHALLKHGAERMSFVQTMQLMMFLIRVITNVGVSGRYASLGLFMHFSRKQEYEADKIGMLIMSRACYNSKYMLSAFEKMKRYEDIHTNKSVTRGLSKYFSTHPSTEERLKEFTKIKDRASMEMERFCRTSNGMRPQIRNWWDKLD